jgi:hypothetical protein
MVFGLPKREPDVVIACASCKGLSDHALEKRVGKSEAALTSI